MNTVTVYDEYIDKNSIFGAYKELHKLAVAQIIMGAVGMLGSLVYWIIPKLGLTVCIGIVCLKVLYLSSPCCLSPRFSLTQLPVLI